MSANDVLTNLDPIIDFITPYWNTLDRNAFNQWTSYYASLDQASLQNASPTNTFILRDTQPFDAPDPEYQKEHSPTVSEFMNAAFSTGLHTTQAPKGLRPFTDQNDKQLEIIDLASGTMAQVWLTENDQVIIAYGVTGGAENMYINPWQLPGGIFADIGLVTDSPDIPAKKDSVGFAQYVVGEADKLGIPAKDVFVTGNSLGALQASYVGQQTGLGGIGFEASGLSLSDTTVGTGDNFISTNTYGDPVASLASDIEGGQPMAPDYDPVNGEHPHYGHNVQFGDPQDQVELSEDIDQYLSQYSYLYGIPGAESLMEAVYFLSQITNAPHHSIKDIYQDFGVTLDPQHTGTPVTVPTPDAYTFDVADLTIGQVLDADAGRTTYHGTALPDSTSLITASGLLG